MTRPLQLKKNPKPGWIEPGTAPERPPFDPETPATRLVTPDAANDATPAADAGRTLLTELTAGATVAAPAVATVIVRPAPAPAAPAPDGADRAADAPLTEDEIKTREAEKAELIAALRAGAVRPIAKPAVAADDAAVADAGGDPLRAVGLVPQQREREHVAKIRAEHAWLATEAEELFSEYAALAKDAGPHLGRGARLTGA
jgi:hypothetical protein